MNKRLWLQQNEPAGFTLLEMLVVIIIVSVLAAIIAPNWLTLMNRQRAAAASDHILQALRETQSSAKTRNIPKTIQFDPTANPPTITYNPGDATGERVEKLAKGDVKPGILGMDITVAGAPVVAPYSITFDNRGGIVEAQTDDIPVMLSATIANTTVKRCIFVETLIGNMRDARDTECN